MTTGNTPDAGHETFECNKRIVKGRYFAEFFIEDSVAGSIYHWVVCRLDGAGLIALGEQASYDIARQEAEHHLMTLINADDSTNFAHVPRAVGA